MQRWLGAVERGCAAPGRWVSWTVPVLVVSVCLTVWLSAMRANVLVEWGFEIPLFGSRLSLAGLNDLQWHLFAAMVMLGFVSTMHDGGHVCVDFLATRFGSRTRQFITLMGDLLLLLPFALIMTWFSWAYMMSAWTSSEGSSYGGLDQRWIIKSVMPLGFGLLAVFGVSRALRTAHALLSGGRG